MRKDPGTHPGISFPGCVECKRLKRAFYSLTGSNAAATVLLLNCRPSGVDTSSCTGTASPQEVNAGICTRMVYTPA